VSIPFQHKVRDLLDGTNARFILQQAMPQLLAVSINGADYHGNWDRLIQPLGRGDFDVEGFLKTLPAWRLMCLRLKRVPVWRTKEFTLGAIQGQLPKASDSARR